MTTPNTRLADELRQGGLALAEAVASLRGVTLELNEIKGVHRLAAERDALTARVAELGKALESAHASRNALVQSGDQSYHLAEALKAKPTEAERTIAGMRAVVEAAQRLVDADSIDQAWLLRELDLELSALDKPAAAELLHDRIPTAEGRTRAAVAHRVPADDQLTDPCVGCGKRSSIFTTGCEHCDYELRAAAAPVAERCDHAGELTIDRSTGEESCSYCEPVAEPREIRAAGAVFRADTFARDSDTITRPK